MRFNLIRRFLQLESASGIILFLMAILAMFWANSPWAYVHQDFIDHFLFLINEGLMTIFFLVVGLELKREYLTGDLSELSQIILPGIAALGGMLVPAAIYWFINRHHPATLRGWATPVATDIAFTLGVLSLFGRRVSLGLKLFLLALAIFDDLGAILIIALFLSGELSLTWVGLSASIFLGLYLLNYYSVRALAPYLTLGLILWYCLLHAGIHPTIAGVLLALTIPHAIASQAETSPLRHLETQLHPYVAFLIMPLFALANAGFSLHGLSLHSLGSQVVLGIVLGLVLGKQIGVFGVAWLIIRAGWAKLPEKTAWLALYAGSILCGIGFTMSLFLGTLSFQNADIYLAEVRLGVIIGSVLSGIIGGIVLLIACTRKRPSNQR